MDEVVVTRREVHYQQGTDRRRRRDLRAQRRSEGLADPPRRAWKRGRKTTFYGDVTAVRDSLWAKLVRKTDAEIDAMGGR
jgi:hypothetical protein